MAAHDVAHWDAQYADQSRPPFVAPEPAVKDLVGQIDGTPGQALDLGCGAGRNAIWLAQQGWQVTAVDYSRNGIDHATRRARGIGVEAEWVVADVTTWRAATAYDLVVVCFFRLEQEVWARVRSWLAPGGHLVVVSHSADPHGRDTTGPRNPAFRHSLDTLRAKADDLEVRRCEEFSDIAADGTHRTRVALLARAAGPERPSHPPTVSR